MSFQRLPRKRGEKVNFFFENLSLLPETRVPKEHFKLVFGSGNSDLAKIRPLKNWHSPDFLSGFALWNFASSLVSGGDSSEVLPPKNSPLEDFVRKSKPRKSNPPHNNLKIKTSKTGPPCIPWQCSKCSSLCRRCQLCAQLPRVSRPEPSAEPPNHGKAGEAAVSTYFRRLKTQFYIGISRFLLGKRPVFFLVGFQNRY